MTDRNMKIMLVDDSETMLGLGREILQEAGYGNVTTCAVGKKAVEILLADKHALILLDWHMPGLTGIDVLHMLKSNPELKDIPVIMLSTENHPRSIETALQNGADAYMVKPLDMDIFNDTLTSLFPEV